MHNDFSALNFREFMYLLQEVPTGLCDFALPPNPSQRAS